MDIRKKATEAAPETGNKNNTKNHIRATVRALFLSLPQQKDLNFQEDQA